VGAILTLQADFVALSWA